MPSGRVPPDLIPLPIRQMAKGLEGAGFVLTEERFDPDVFGNALMTFASGSLLVRAVRDRGIWIILISMEGWDPWWFPPQVWQAHLDASDLFQSVIALDEQVTIASNLLPRIRDLLEDDPETTKAAIIERMRARHRVWMRGRDG